MEKPINNSFANNFTFKKPDGSLICIEAESQESAKAIFDKEYPPVKGKGVKSSK